MFHSPHKTYISSAKDANLPQEEILDSLAFLSWYMHRFWKNLVRHIFQATKIYSQHIHLINRSTTRNTTLYLGSKLVSGIFCNYHRSTVRNYTKLKIDRKISEIKNYNAKNQPFAFSNFTKKTNKSLEAPSIENIDIVNSRPMDSI